MNTKTNNNVSQPTTRLSSLDAFRGITIALMILVNMASIAGKDVYPPLLHAKWYGWTVTDFIFPFFLFIIGVAMAFSLSKYTEGNKSKFTALRRIIRRTIILFILVLFGLSCLVIGGIWDIFFPINKKLWTSSYVVFTTGWALLVLAGCYELIEVRHRKGGESLLR